MKKTSKSGLVLAAVVVGLLGMLLATSTGGATAGTQQRGGPRHFEIVEASISDLKEALEKGWVTSHDLVEMYLARIEAYDQQGPTINSIITINPDALARADALDAERAAGRTRGPLHGIPIVVKDNYDTADMPTAAGSLALQGSFPEDDGFQVRQLREAGAIILAKTNMHEFAFGLETFSSLGGQTRNPYDLTRNPGGSSGGTGASVAASFAAAGMGTDTCGSIRSPSFHNSLVGIRATKGLSSIDGIVPLAKTQDVGGPLARTVEDVALILDATVGYDPADPITALGVDTIPRSYRSTLDKHALRGARIGVLDSLFGPAPEDEEVNEIVRAAAAEMAGLGATVVHVDGTEILSILLRPVFPGVVEFDEHRVHLEEYLAATPGAPRKTLQEILDSGLVHPGLLFTLGASLASTAFGTEEYKDRLLERDELKIATLAAMAELDLDALVYPTVNRKAALIGEPQEGHLLNCSLSARTGMPAISVPAGFTDDGLPVGVELLGRPFAESTLLGLGYSYEQGTHHRRPPTSTPALGR